MAAEVNTDNALILNEDNLKYIQEILTSGSIDYSFVIFCDPSEECDDELALYLLIEFIMDFIKRNPEIKIKIIVVFTNGSATSNVSPLQRFEHFKHYFKEWETYSFMIYVTDLSLLGEIVNVSFDSMLRIAPLTGVPPQFFGANHIKKYFVMGDAGSLNTTGSFISLPSEERKRFMDQYNEQEAYLTQAEEKITISSALGRVFTLTAGMRKLLPAILQDFCLETAFKMSIGRVPGHIGYCQRVTFEANYPTLKSFVCYMPEWYEFCETKNLDTRENLLIDQYWDSILIKPPDYLDPGKEEEYKLKLKEMFMIVKFITGETYEDSTFSVESLSNYSSGFENFRSKAIKLGWPLMPSYDLIACNVMIQNVFNKNFLDLRLENVSILQLQTEELLEKLKQEKDTSPSSLKKLKK